MSWMISCIADMILLIPYCVVATQFSPNNSINPPSQYSNTLHSLLTQW